MACRALPAAIAAALLAGTPARGATWRVGDGFQPWSLHPVSFVFVTGEEFAPEYAWGGSYAVEVVVDDDGDGAVDEDPVDRVDDDGDNLWNEDPADGVDNDDDGAVDEDGPDPQVDGDGDGLVNEDGLHTGGPIYQPAARQAYASAPFYRYPTAAEAAADERGWATGWGWGDDDLDARFNEDPVDGRDDDGDGLVDEDDVAPDPALPATWSRPVFAYPASGLPVEARRALRFLPAAGGGSPRLRADGPGGDAFEAVLERRSFGPVDWIRPIHLDPARNVARLADDRFLAGLFGEQDPLQLGSQIGTPRDGDSGNGQCVDGNIQTAKSVVGNWGLGTELRGLFWIDRIRYLPRPNFPDRTPASFAVYFGGDDPGDFRTSLLGTQLVASRFLIPRQVDQYRPVVKDYRVDPPQKVRVVSMGSQVREGDTWEIAESELYGHGYALDASYFTEIIDVGPTVPRARRYYDPAEPGRPVPFELIRSVDANSDGALAPQELAAATAAAQFDPDLPGQAVSWGRVRWRGAVAGVGGDVQVRVRTGSSLDPRLYQRRVGPGVTSAFVEAPILLDWPARGSRLDAHSYAALPSVARAPYRELPANLFGAQDGVAGGWTPWSAPIDFAAGAVAVDGAGGLTLALPPLMRYIQFRFDFASTQDSGASLDYLEFDYSRPVVPGGVVAEIYPDTAAVLGRPLPFQYVLRPRFGGAEGGFNRIDISVPTPDAAVDSLLVDGRRWTPVAVGTDLDGVSLAQKGSYASAVYRDADGLLFLGLETAPLGPADFPRGQDRDLQVFFHAPLYHLLTRFESRVWDDADAAVLPQPATAGNAADTLPGDGVAVTVLAPTHRGGDLAVGPNPFTPNGDGVNDAVVFDLSLQLFLGPTRVRLDLATLAGGVVRTIGPQELAVGRHALRWDGLDDHGARVPPGLYLYRLTTESDGGDQTRVGAVAVAY